MGSGTPVYKPYVDGLENLPSDGRFLLVANHSYTPSSEILLLLYEVQRHLGRRVRALMDRRFGRFAGLAADVLAAGGGIVGTREGTAELMRANEPILVFPGGAREIGKGKDQLNTLQWGDRAGFARLAIEHNYRSSRLPLSVATTCTRFSPPAMARGRSSARKSADGWAVTPICCCPCHAA